MKRSLVLDYGSSEDEEQPVRKKTLPQLSANLTVPAPVDDPSKHQGRQRTRQHVEGQFAAHVYVSIQPNSETRTLLEKIVQEAQSSVPEIHTLINHASEVPPSASSTEQENDDPKPIQAVAPSLHISLSRPIYLRAHQREDLKRTVRVMASQFAPFMVSFASLQLFQNDEKTREFISIEIGAGHHELKKLAEALSPQLRLFYQQSYYDAPRFHSSIAWALLRPSNPASSNIFNGNSSKMEEVIDSESPPRSLEEESQSSNTSFPSVTDIPRELITKLQESHGKDLQRLGRFKIRNICVRIGKDVKEWRLAGSG
ncbi:poly(U)-specific 3'-to-5' RNA exonuclease [Tulasnella sp. 419]|nr:poly(U)-specific 3'-to-5' RNA exonuclease [Tulasnella sp. 418]KAG8963258.1 poly(U)-specific 3'-to-5' RNA exonuclease [Tulasnella sp. 419]